MKISHITASKIPSSIISDNIWGWKAVDLKAMGRPKFKVEDTYDWVVELKPKDSLMGVLISPFISAERQLRVEGSATSRKPWVRLFTPLEKLGFDIAIALVNKKRVDTMTVTHQYAISGKSICANYECIIEAEVDAGKFYKYLSMPGNNDRIRKTLESEIRRHIDNLLNNRQNIFTRLEGEISHKFLADAGYNVVKVEIIYLSNQQAA